MLNLRNFSRLDEAEMKPVNIHEGIDSTLLILQSRLKHQGNNKEIQVINPLLSVWEKAVAERLTGLKFSCFRYNF
jgi:C4-dicarboxylate-specific signal transduction histidine kinase